ncbi:MAG: DUF4280 domain-containing protein, partial [Flavobacteriaceae bacterium]|nr:DUF4280 domain-containing protein [Flavobacteriaceae bacterium]
MEEWHFRHTVRAGKFTGKIYNQHGTTYAKAKNYSKNRESGVLDDDTIFAEEHIWFPNGAQCPDCEDMRPVHTDPEPVTPVGPSQNMVLNQSHYLKKLAPIFGGQTQKLEETTEIKFDKEAKKGYLVCQGAKLYCIKSANANNKGSALPFTKLSQEKIVLANEMPVATTKDNTVAHINFGSCASKYPNVPCAARLQWKHINKNIEVGGGYPLLSISKADCNAMGEKEVVSIAEHGQGNEVSSVLEDSTTASSKIYLVSPLIRPAKAKKKPSVTAISLFHNNKKIQGNSSLSIEKKANKKHCFRFEASFKNGSEWRINWAIYKKKDSELIKLKEYRNHGKILQFETDQQTETGEFIIEAFGRKSNPTRYKKCTIQIQYQANGILENSIQNTHNTSTVLAEEVIAFSCKKRFDSPLNIQWYVYEITEEAKILYYSPELPKPTIDKPQNIWQNLFGMVTNRSLGDGMDIEPYQFSILFKNQGTYLVVAEDANGKRISKEFKAVSHPKLNKISHGPIKLSPNQHIEAAVTKSNVALDSLEHKNCYWHLKKGGKVFPFQTQGTSFQLAVKELQYRGLTSNLYGSYILEASGDGTKGNFSGTDSYLFEVCNNYLVQIPNIPIYLPIGAKWKPKPILNMPQQLDQKMVFSSTNLEDLSKLQLSDSVQINALGSYKLYAQLEGEYTDTTKGLDIQIQAVHIQFKKALWCYGNNRKRWQIGAGEIAFAYLKLQHLSNHPINISIWVQGEVSSPGEAMSDPKNLLLTQSAKIDAQGNAQLKFETTEEMVEKIQNALNLIELENIPLFFTFSLHKKNMSFELGDNVQIIDANGDQIPQIAVDGVAHYIVLEPSERLVYTQQQKVKSVLFSNPEKTDIQLGKTTKEVTHAIWVHTTGMVGQKLSLAVYQKMGDDTVAASFSSSTTTADNQSMAQGVVASAVEKYEDQEIPKSGYLQLDFSVPAWTPEDQSAFFSIEVFQKQPDGSIKDMGHGYQSSFVQKYIAPDLNQVEIQALVDLDNATDEIKAKIAKKLVCHNQLYAVPPNLLPAQTDT